MVDYMVAMTMIQYSDSGRSEQRRKHWTLSNSGETKSARVSRRFPWRMGP